MNPKPRSNYVLPYTANRLVDRLDHRPDVRACMEEEALLQVKSSHNRDNIKGYGFFLKEYYANVCSTR